MEFLLIWFGLALIVGFIGKDKKVGFGGGFLWSLFLSPLIGFIIVLASGPVSYVCKYCGHPKGIDIEFCTNCGKNKYGKTIDFYSKK